MTVSPDKLHCPDDAQLVAAARCGDDSAFEELVRRYLRVVMLYADRYSHSPHDKDDYLQEGLCGLLKAVRTYNGISSSFSTYASVCIRTSIITAVRKDGRDSDRLVSYEETVSESDGSDSITPEDIIIQKESTDFLYERFKSVLSEYESNVFDLFLLDLTYADIALCLKTSQKSVENAVRRIRTKLKALIAKS